MNTLKKLFILTFIAGFAINVTGQSNAGGTITTSSASAELLIPMQITEDTPFHFGSIVNLVYATGGTVVMSSISDAPTYTTVAAATTGTVIAPKRGEFSITGTANEAFEVSEIANFNITNTTNGTNTLEVSSITYSFNGSTDSSSRASNLDASGNSDLFIGGTLTIPSNTVGGLYTGTYTVIVDYN
jgi:hypothetical protein